MLPNMRTTLTCLVASLLAGTALQAQRITPQLWKEWEDREIRMERLDPPLDPAPEFWSSTTIRGMVFLGALDQLKPEGVEELGVVVRAPEVLNTAAFRKQMWGFLGRNLDYDTMRAIQAETLLYLRDHYRPLVDVIYPEQDVTEGIIQIVVREAVVGKLELRDPGSPASPITNKWANLDYINKVIRLKSGSVVDTLTLEEDLDWLTRNPYREIAGQVTFSKGAGPQEADIYTSLRHRKPWDVYVGYDNTGSEATDMNRVYLGLAGGGVLGNLDNFGTYQFIADPELKHLKAHAASYTALLPWRHTLRVFGYYSDSSADVTDNNTVTGESYQGSLRYEVPLPRIGRMQQSFQVGMDYKHLGNTLEFGGTPVQDSPWEVFQFNGAYVAYASDSIGRTVLTAEGFYSPGDVTSLNDQEAYDQVRRGSPPDYYLGRVQLDRWFELPEGFYFRVRGAGQLASDQLLPSEQLGLGGRNSVRGFPEREVNTDQGWFASAEFITPSWIGRRTGTTPTRYLDFTRDPETYEHGLFFVAFIDYGGGRNFNPQPDEEDRELASVGGGVRYKFRRNVDLLFDYGSRIRESGFEATTDTSFHISARVSY